MSAHSRLLGIAWRLEYDAPLTEDTLREVMDTIFLAGHDTANGKITLSVEGMQDFLAMTTGERHYQVSRDRDSPPPPSASSPAHFAYDPGHVVIGQDANLKPNEMLLECPE